MKRYFNKTYLPAMVGTAIEYYDVSLYGYMAPILVQVFLPNFDKLKAYLYYFAFEIFAALCQILGSHFFGRIGDTAGRKKAMYYSMLGTSFITFMIAIVPTYNDIGIYAALMFASCRAAQSFFLGGEYNGGAIYCLEHEQNPKKHTFVSGIYGASTVFGVLAAAFVATSIMNFGKEYFRFAYCLSLVFAILTFYLRRNMQETPEYLEIKNKLNAKSTTIIANYKMFIGIALASLLCGVLYGFPTRIFNIIIPIATGISSVNIMTINCVMLVIYAFLLILVGRFYTKYAPASAMISSALLILVLTFPAIALVESKTVVAIVFAKLTFTCLSAAFIAPLHAWTQSISRTENRYRHVSMAYSSGKLCAICTLPITILLFEKYNNLFIPAAIIVALAIIYLLFIAFLEKRREQ